MHYSVSPQSSKGMQFGLIFFASGEDPRSHNKYHVVIESARFADQHDFSSIWIPERHFTKDGCLYPNPVVLQAALARETQRIHLRAGSVVMPLHDPIRVAEDWSIVDNLSGGRVGLSFASGWHPSDFVFAPDRYADRHEEMYRGIEKLQQLWQGQSITVKGGDGKLVEISTYPTPIQASVPIWITAAGNPETFIRAGKMGANLLTHLFNQTIEELDEKIKLYRAARAEHGHDPDAGQVSLMLHAFVSDDPELINEQVRPAFCDYLKATSYLLTAIAQSRGQKVDLSQMSEQDAEEYMGFVFDRLVSTNRVLFGTPESCLDLVAKLKAVGVDEIACQLDFGVPADLLLPSLVHLNSLRERCNTPEFAARIAAASQASTSTTQPVEPERSPAPAPKNGHDQPQPTAQPAVRLHDVQQRCRQELPVAAFYDRLRAQGVQMDLSFRGIQRLWRGTDEALGLVQLPESVAREIDSYTVHPALLDACFQLLGASLPETVFTEQDGSLYLPVGLRSFCVHAPLDAQVWSHARLQPGTSSTPQVFEGDVRILNQDGSQAIEALGLRLQQIQHPLPQTSPEHDALGNWFYELTWQPQDHPGSMADAQPAQDRTWLIFADRGGVGEALAARLRSQGDQCVMITPGSDYTRLDANQYQLQAEHTEDFQRLLGDVVQSDRPNCDIVHLWSLDANTREDTTTAALEHAQVTGSVSVLRLVQALAAHSWAQSPRVWLVTQGAQQPDESSASPLAMAQTPLWGFGSTIAQEHPDLWGGLIDLDAAAVPGSLAAFLATEIQHPTDEDHVALHKGQRYVARLVHARKATVEATPFEWHTDGSYLITGGLGELGLLIARWMVQQGARSLILLGRTPLPPRASWDQVAQGTRQAAQIAAVRELEQLGADVQIAVVDVADEAQLSAFLTSHAESNSPRLRGVVHAAGVVTMQPLLELDTATLNAVLRPKVMGSWNLHRLLANTPLDFFVLFSSWASFVGMLSQGLGSYGAANAFLDSLAQHRRALGLPALSVDWGDWAEVGMRARYLSTGQRLLPGDWTFTPQQGLDALDRLLRSNATQVAVLPVDWQRWGEMFPQAGAAPLFSNLMAEVGAADEQTLSQEAQHIRQALASGSTAERKQLIDTYMREKIAAAMRLPAARVDLEQPLNNLGIDSLMAIEMKNRIVSDLGISLSIGQFLQGANGTQIAGEILSRLDEILDVEAPAAIAADEPTEENVEQLLQDLDQLSDEEVDRLLNKMLN